MKRLYTIITIVFFSTMTTVLAQQPLIDGVRAKECFTRFDQLRNNDNGTLWGKALPRKMLFVEPQSYCFVANAPVSVYATEHRDGLYYGQYPKEKAIANTSVLIDSTPWTMVLWPLPDDMDVALELMAHEAFHNLQHELDVQASVMSIPHMEKKDARILFRLEMQALFEALFQRNTQAIKHALFFRQKRFDQHPQTQKEEVLLETQEGLAQYTGYKLAYTDRDRLKTRLLVNIERMAQKSSLSRATAYTSGPLYGLLLDASGKPWRKSAVRHFQAFELVMNCYAIEKCALDSLHFDTIKMLYNFEAIDADEAARWKKRQQKITQYTRKLIEDQPLVIELVDKQIGFNPNSIIPLEGYGNVYEYFVLRDWFGVLTAKKGALMTNDWSRVYISKPLKINTDTIRGDGWIIELNDKYELTEKQQGYSLTKKGT